MTAAVLPQQTFPSSGRARKAAHGSGIHSFTAFFIVMPYLGIGGLPTDVQPFALPLSVLSLIVMAATNGSIKVTGASFVLMLALMLACLGFVLGTPIQFRDFFYDLRALYGYINSLFIFLFFTNYLLKTDRSGPCWVADIALAVTFFGFFLNIVGQTQLIQLVVSRAEFEYDGMSDFARGLTSFFPEQSRLSNQMVLLICLYYAIGRLNLTRLALVILMAALSASGQFFVNLSVLVAAFTLMALLSSGVTGHLRARIYGVLLVVAGLFGFFLYYVYNHTEDLVAIGFPIRGIEAFREILSLNLYALGQDYGFLFKISGPLQGMAATWAAPFSFELGQTFYFQGNIDYVSTYEGILNWIFQPDRIPYPERAFSIFGAWFGDFKLIGLFVSIFYFYCLHKQVSKASPEIRYVARALLLVAFFLFLTRSNTSDPTFWATVAAIYVCGTTRYAGVQR